MKRDAARSAATALGGLIALAAAMGIGRFVYTPILPFMEAALGLTKSQAGLLASANFLGYLLGALAAAQARLPGGRRNWFLVALAASALTTGLMGATDNFPAFLTLRFVGGFASAFVLVFSSTLVLDRLAAAGRPGLAALHFAGVGTGIALSAIVVAGAAMVEADWRHQWVASGMISLLGLGVVALLIREDSVAPEPVPDETGPSREPNRTRRRPATGSGKGLGKLILAYGAFGFGYVITATFISTLVRATPEARALESVIWLLVGLSAVPSVAFWVWVGRRWGNDRSFALACGIEGLGVALSVLSTDSAALALSAVLLGGTFMGITALGLIIARSLAEGDPRRTIGLMTAAFGLGQMIGPSFAGFAYGLGESFLVPSLVAAAALMAAAALSHKVLSDPGNSTI